MDPVTIPLREKYRYPSGNPSTLDAPAKGGRGGPGNSSSGKTGGTRHRGKPTPWTKAGHNGTHPSTEKA